MSSQGQSDVCLYVTQRGMARDRRPLYAIIKHIPPNGRHAGGELELRCVDLWKDAYALDQGCSYTQFLDDPEHLKCKGCGLSFSKFYLRSSLLISIAYATSSFARFHSTDLIHSLDPYLPITEHLEYANVFVSPWTFPTLSNFVVRALRLAELLNISFKPYQLLCMEIAPHPNRKP
ncbi:hypothetical protein FRC03_006728 [Tulasnella sp. 419]|nr:hypothetical protein FRC02_000046 [Tulasnella sp. 418]KAG8968607.1 hypothetical protein FRC03_006728 [Tulasnella sp. 419]